MPDPVCLPPPHPSREVAPPAAISSMRGWDSAWRRPGDLSVFCGGRTHSPSSPVVNLQTGTHKTPGVPHSWVAQSPWLGRGLPLALGQRKFKWRLQLWMEGQVCGGALSSRPGCAQGDLSASRFPPNGCLCICLCGPEAQVGWDSPPHIPPPSAPTAHVHGLGMSLYYPRPRLWHSQLPENTYVGGGRPHRAQVPVEGRMDT